MNIRPTYKSAVRTLKFNQWFPGNYLSKRYKSTKLAQLGNLIFATMITGNVCAQESGILVPEVAGVASVFPAPNSTEVPLSVVPRIDTTDNTYFAWTGGEFAIRDQNGSVVFSYNPDQGDPQEGQTSITLDLEPNALQPGTTYTVTAGNKASRLNAAPWSIGTIADGIWTFTTEGESGQPDPDPDPTPNPGPDPDPQPDPEPDPDPEPNRDPFAEHIIDEQNILDGAKEYVINWRPQGNAIYSAPRIQDMRDKYASGFDPTVKFVDWQSRNTGESTGWGINAATMTMAYLITGEQRYATKAIKLADELISEEPASCRSGFQLRLNICMDDLSYVLSILYGQLTDTQKEQYEQRLIDFTELAISSYIRDGNWGREELRGVEYLSGVKLDNDDSYASREFTTAAYRGNNFAWDFTLAKLKALIALNGRQAYADDLAFHLFTQDLPTLAWYVRHRLGCDGNNADGINCASSAEGNHYKRKTALAGASFTAMLADLGATEAVELFAPYVQGIAVDYLHNLLPSKTHSMQTGDAAMIASMPLHGYDISLLSLVCQAMPGSDEAKMARHFIDNIGNYETKNWVRSVWLEETKSCPLNTPHLSHEQTLPTKMMNELGEFSSRDKWLKPGQDASEVVHVFQTPIHEDNTQVAHGHPPTVNAVMGGDDGSQDYLLTDNNFEMNEGNQAGNSETGRANGLNQVADAHNLLLVDGKAGRFDGTRTTDSPMAVRIAAKSKEHQGTDKGYLAVQDDYSPSYANAGHVQRLHEQYVRTIVHAGEAAGILLIHDRIILKDPASEVAANFNTTNQWTVDEANHSTWAQASGNYVNHRVLSSDEVSIRTQYGARNMQVVDRSHQRTKTLANLFQFTPLAPNADAVHPVAAGEHVDAVEVIEASQSTVILVAKDEGTSSIAYQLSGNTKAQHILVGLEPEASYEVVVDGTLHSVFTTDNNGIQDFYTLGQNIAITKR